MYPGVFPRNHLASIRSVLQDRGIAIIVAKGHHATSLLHPVHSQVCSQRGIESIVSFHLKPRQKFIHFIVRFN